MGYRLGKALRGAAPTWLRVSALMLSVVETGFTQDLESTAQRFATLLRDPGGDRAVVSRVRDDPKLLAAFVSLLKNPPRSATERDLVINLARAAGQLRVAQAIPFLIEHITLEPWLDHSANIWLKTDQSILSRLPCIKALVEIGPEAGQALMKRPLASYGGGERLAVEFVVSRSRAVGAAEYLSLLPLDADISWLERECLKEAIAFLKKKP